MQHEHIECLPTWVVGMAARLDLAKAPRDVGNVTGQALAAWADRLVANPSAAAV